MATDEIENMTKEQFQQLAGGRHYCAGKHGGKFIEWCLEEGGIEGCSEDGKIVVQCALMLGKTLNWLTGGV